MYKKFNEIYHFIDKFKETDFENLNAKISLIYRNYNNKIDVNLIKRIHSFCKKTKRKFYLANEIKLAYQLKLDGAYIPSFNKSLSHNYFIKNKKFKLLGSGHNQKEIKLKQKQNIKYIFLSPVFEISKNNSCLGINKFLILKNLSNQNIIALGGINKLNIKKLNMLNCYGFASISFIKTLNHR
jgi:thiamine-phosphate pyrophosphorylase